MELRHFAVGDLLVRPGAISQDREYCDGARWTELLINCVFALQPLADVVKHVEVGYKMEAPEGCPSEIYEMMRQAWDLNPSRRPSFSDLKVKLLQLKSITT